MKCNSNSDDPSKDDLCSFCTVSNTTLARVPCWGHKHIGAHLADPSGSAWPHRCCSPPLALWSYVSIRKGQSWSLQGRGRRFSCCFGFCSFFFEKNLKAVYSCCYSSLNHSFSPPLALKDFYSLMLFLRASPFPGCSVTEGKRSPKNKNNNKQKTQTYRKRSAISELPLQHFISGSFYTRCLLPPTCGASTHWHPKCCAWGGWGGGEALTLLLKAKEEPQLAEEM